MPGDTAPDPGAAARHRLSLALAGPRDWARQQALTLLAGFGADALWVTDAPPEGVEALPAERARRLLGRDLPALVFDAWAGLDLEALGATTGAVVGGGLFLLLCPGLDAWPEFADPDHARIAVHPFTAADVPGRFLRRMARIVAAHPGIHVITPTTPWVLVNQRLRAHLQAPPAAGPQSVPPPCRTPDQARAVEAVLRVARGHRRRPVVITAHRGRGKSTALGIAAARLLQHDYGEIVVTAPDPGAAEAAFLIAARLLGQGERHRFAIHHGGSALRFAAPDGLLRETQRPRLVLVDEAAAIPTPVLTRLLQRHARIVFATTEHGYEGSGRGFTLRFRKALDTLTRRWREVRLEHPIRWAPGDPLEAFASSALLLDAAPAPADSFAGVQVGELAFERLDRGRLVEDEALLGELFGLLVTAHYRTRPTDLRHLLDGLNLRVWVARWKGRLAACALTAREGGFDTQAATEIYERRRRPHGHLLPETLAAHAGLPEAPTLHCERVLRIAVHPRLQGRGIGSALIRHLAAHIATEPRDYLGASFGATEDLLRFWARLGLHPVRLGIHRGAASGEHSAVVMRPLSAAGTALYRRARARFLDAFPHLLTDPLRDLEPGLAARLLRRLPGEPPPAPLDGDARRDAACFAFGRRGYEVSLTALWRLGLCGLGAGVELPPPLLAPWMAKVMQRLDWETTARRTGLGGRAAVERALRQAAAGLIRGLRQARELGDNDRQRRAAIDPP